MDTPASFLRTVWFGAVLLAFGASAFAGSPSSSSSSAKAAQRGKTQTQPAAKTSTKAKAPRTAAAVVVSRKDATPKGPLSLNLQQCMDTALRENFSLRITRVDSNNSEQDYQIARAAFDPVFRLNAATSFSRSPTANSQLDGATVPESESVTYGGAIDQLLFTGGTLTLDTGADRFENNSSFSLLNPSYDADLRVTLRQPLLKGGGLHNTRIPLLLARVELAVADLSNRRAILSTMAEVETAFWDLGLRRLARDARAAAVNTSQQLLYEIDARLDAGLANRVDRLRGETTLANQREALLISEQEVARATDELARLLGRQTFDGINFVGNSAFSYALPDSPVPDSDGVLARAEQVEPEYLIVKQGLVRSDLQVDRAKNNALPQVDVVASGGYAGRSSNYRTAYDNAIAGDGYQWNVGVQVSVPWGMREERARLQQAKNGRETARLQTEEAHQRLALAVRAACRDAQAARLQIAATTTAQRLSVEQADQIKAQYDQGLVEFRDVLEARDTVTQAQVNTYRARFAAVRAQIEIGRLDGSLLERHHLSWK